MSTGVARAGAGSFLLLAGLLSSSQLWGSEVDPALCVSAERTSIVVEWGGRLHYLTSEECRALFASDPERYGQLFEVLAESPVLPTPRRASLVPS